MSIGGISSALDSLGGLDLKNLMRRDPKGKDGAAAETSGTNSLVVPDTVSAKADNNVMSNNFVDTNSQGESKYLAANKAGSLAVGNLNAAKDNTVNSMLNIISVAPSGDGVSYAMRNLNGKKAANMVRQYAKKDTLEKGEEALQKGKDSIDKAAAEAGSIPASGQGAMPAGVVAGEAAGASAEVAAAVTAPTAAAAAASVDIAV